MTECRSSSLVKKSVGVSVDEEFEQISSFPNRPTYGTTETSSVSMIRGEKMQSLNFFSLKSNEK